jgi:hypothetical protein
MVKRVRKRNAAQVDRGQELAVRLGWPRESIGFIGATSAMLDLGARWQELDSMLTVIKHREAQSEACVRVAIAKDVAALLPSDSDN